MRRPLLSLSGRYKMKKEIIMAIRNWKDIPLFKDVTDEQWNDWHWQVSHRLSTVEQRRKLFYIRCKRCNFGRYADN